ncbi:MAG: response regulator transcription factor [Melioribacteraceae bacterium]|jgi:DNA-binding response OmpR family regulator|nr:response regulator transcription factor [Melioribacteraceae bacterium]
MSKANVKILLVEDDANLGTLLKEFLTVKNFDVVHTLNGEDALKIFNKNSFDICILDVMMPKVDGFTLAAKIRSISDTPFVFLSAKSMLDDKLEGLKLGADDYISKPFSMEELILRINAVLKRNTRHIENHNKTVIQIGNYKFHFDTRTLCLNKKEQKLTSREAELLNLLCLKQNELLERSEALHKIWKNDSYFTSRSMDVYVTKLRGYLKGDLRIQIINVHGSGFKLVVG